MTGVTIGDVITWVEDRICLARACAAAEPEAYAEGRQDGYINGLLELLLWIEEQE